jgi:DNA-binding SARP family transcriptional activator
MIHPVGERADRSPPVSHARVEVAVLGPVTVSGLPLAFRRAAARELVAYLAFHREGVRHAEWSTALWPDRPVTLATAHSTASDARRALGRAADDALRLPCGSVLRLHPSVVTDVDRFSVLSRARTCEGWIEAAGLVRGPLFGGLRLADWAILDGTAARVEAMVVHTVLQAAETLRGDGRAAEAEWIVRRGLLASPFDERLYRSLLVALAAQGNRTGMRAAMEQFSVMAKAARTTFRDPDAGRSGSLHPETTGLYRDLLRGWPAPGGVPARL